MLGYDLQTFNNRAYQQITAPVAQGVLIWAPSGLTTVTGRVSRTIEDSIGQTTSGVVLTQASLTVDHEYLRNVLLQGRFGAISSQFTGSQTQSIYDFGGSVSYLFNRNMRLTATLDYFDSVGNAGNQLTLIPVAAEGNDFVSLNSYSREVGLLSLRFTL